MQDETIHELNDEDVERVSGGAGGAIDPNG